MSPRKYRRDKRNAAVEETRRRIVEATMALHNEQGILATSWEDIARRADVAVATVYRHFPSLAELAPACGELVEATIRPPTPALGPTLFAHRPALTDRVQRLVQELCAFYERGAASLTSARRDSHQLPPVQAWLDSLAMTREFLVREALQPAAPDAQTIQIVTALTDFPVWQALHEREVSKEVITRVIHDSVLCWVARSSSSDPC